MLYTGVWGFICLVPRFHYCARPMRFGSRGPSEFSRPSRSSRVRHQNALTEKAWEGRRTGTRLGLGKGKQGLYFSGYTLRDRTFHFWGGRGRPGVVDFSLKCAADWFRGKKMHNTGQKSYTVVCQEKILSPEVWEKINTTFMARILVRLWMGRVNVETNKREI